MSWSSEDFISAHNAVRASGKFNFQGCKISIPTKIRYDRIREALGVEASLKELRVLNLLRFGMPMDCNAWFGIKRVQNNHFSAVTHKEAIETYLAKNKENQAILGPFTTSPIKDLCFSPLMSVPKEVSKHVSLWTSSSLQANSSMMVSLNICIWTLKLSLACLPSRP